MESTQEMEANCSLFVLDCWRLGAMLLSVVLGNWTSGSMELIDGVGLLLKTGLLRNLGPGGPRSHFDSEILPIASMRSFQM